MKLFRKDSGYAVRTLVFIAQQNQTKPVSSTYVSERLGIPKNFLRRIFSKLIRAGILRATEGVHGGVVLAKSPASITVGEIILALQGNIKICNYSHNHTQCLDYTVCPIREKIVAMEHLVSDEFHAITIQSLMDDGASVSREYLPG